MARDDDGPARPWYLERAPAADLRDELACVWRAEVGGTRTLIPDGCLDLLWIDDGSLWLCGPETQAWSFTLPPLTEAVGVRFRPGVASAVLGVDVAELLNTRVPIDEDPLTNEVGDRRDARGRVAVLQEHVRSIRQDADPVAVTVAERLAFDRAPVHELAGELGLSERHLRRRCTLAFGYGPSTLARILRLQRFLAAARRHGTAGGLATLAVMSGYADQPHLNRDVKDIADMTPTELVRSVQDRDTLAVAH
jgi:AraC-like DNA-binding protein